MRTLCLTVLCLAACGVAPIATPQAAEVYDLVFRGGKVVDGTGNPWFVGDVAVRGDKIVAVARTLPGKGTREINAKGLVVTPGFIDIHSHSDLLILEDGNAPSKVRQGVTTEVFGEGNSAGPYPDDGKLPVGGTRRFLTLDKYFRGHEQLCGVKWSS